MAWASAGAFAVDLASGFVPASFRAGAMGAVVQGGIAYAIGKFAPSVGVSSEHAQMMAIGGGVRAAITLLAPVFNSITGFLRPGNGTGAIAQFTPGHNMFPAYGGGFGAIAQWQPGQNMFPAYGGGNLAGIVR